MTYDGTENKNGDNGMADVQNRTDTRRIKIDQVGVKKIRYPVNVKDRDNGSQRTVASVNMFVELPHNHKGTHMSRFIEILAKHRHSISSSTIPSILLDMKERLQAESAHMELSFPFFMEKRAPVTGALALMEYGCILSGTQAAGAEPDLTVAVVVPVTTLCPCSKEISSFGAHNQRGLVTVTVRYRHFFWIEDLIKLVEGSGSSEVFSLLKRTDEKFVTETAYNNPRFVEDVVREVAVKLRADDNFFWFSVAAENFESIHNHSAYAFLEYSRDEHAEDGLPAGGNGAERAQADRQGALDAQGAPSSEAGSQGASGRPEAEPVPCGREA
jgi:GTP cyclohydrolase I